MCAHRNGREFGRAVRRLVDTPVGEPCQRPGGQDKGIGDLYRATERDGTFCYTFFKALAVR